MAREDLHLSDEEMLLTADGELPPVREAQVRAHLAACWGCRSRMAEIEATIIDFARDWRRHLDPQLPPIDGPRALLRVQLGELASRPGAGSGGWFLRVASATGAVGFLSAVIFIAGLGTMFFFLRSNSRDAKSIVPPFERGLVPDHNLTPGATRNVTISEVCTMAHEEVIAEVSNSLRQKVLQEYGIVNSHPDDYEIDYLIAPGLGGVEEIHNLWPEPYLSAAWNAHVKDDLEEHLHQLVCAGNLDLSTAQRDITSDWIAAYKKYFHTDRPLSLRSRIDSKTLFEFGGTDSAQHFGD